MISLDTELMRQLVTGCDAANDAIGEAVAALTGITSHNDWGCKEKNSIDEYTNTNKKRVFDLQECSSAFLKVLRQITYDFEEAEKGISDMFGGVDAAVADIVGIPVWKVVSISKLPEGIGQDTSIVSSINDAAKSAMNNVKSSVSINSMNSYLKKTFFDNIAVCNYDDIVVKM